MFEPFANKIDFEPFTLDSAPCPKCSCKQVLIAPTLNTHAASSRCSNSNCGKFYRWLGRKELLHCIVEKRRSPERSSVSGQQAVQQAEATRA